MTKAYESKWVREIIGAQQEDGSGGYFHTLSQPVKGRSMTTEQALRRLRVLGLTREDEPVSRALDYMRDCLMGKRQPPDGREQVLNWDAFERHMMAAWIRLFVPDDPLALSIAEMWAELVTFSFHDGSFDGDAYAAAYRKRVPVLHKGERLIMLPQFYMVNILKGMLDRQTENRFVDYIINNDNGIYYVYDARLAEPPATFASKRASRYIAALEQLAGYACAGAKLQFAINWLRDNMNEQGEWDLGAAAKDGGCFPISDSWRRPEDRVRDCTLRIRRLIDKLGG